MWVIGRITFLRGHESQGSTARPDVELRLNSSQRLYLRLLMQVVRAGMIEFAHHAEPSVAPFLVVKGDGSGKVRMVLDARRALRHHRIPDVRGAWQGLGTAVGRSLNIAQIDMECPPGLSKLLVLRPLRRAHFIAQCPYVSHVGSSQVSPRLILLSSVKPRWKQ